MKRIMFAGAVALMVMGAQVAGAAEASVSVDLASAYVFRGVTFNDGLVVQPGVEVGSILGDFLPLSAGVWGNLDVDDYDGSLEAGQFSELDVFLSLGVPLPEDVPLSIGFGYCEYTYPSGGGDADREVSASFGVDVPSSPTVTVNYGVEGGIDETLYVEASVGHDQAIGDTGIEISVGADIGYVDVKGGESGFSHYDLSAGISYSLFSASVTYVGQIDDDVLPDGMGAYDTEVVGMIGISRDL